VTNPDPDLLEHAYGLLLCEWFEALMSDPQTRVSLPSSNDEQASIYEVVVQGLRRICLDEIQRLAEQGAFDG